MDTDTPRTDAAIEILNSEEKASCVHVEFARTLERELGEAKAKLSKLSRMIDIAGQSNDSASESEVANSATFLEAMAHTNTEMVEAECDQLRAEVEKLKETHIMQLAAISVAANSNTDSTLEQALKCHPNYKSVALSVVVVAIQREIWERNQKDQWRAVAERLAPNLVNCMGHVSGEHKHWKEGFNTIAAYEKLKAGK